MNLKRLFSFLSSALVTSFLFGQVPIMPDQFRVNAPGEKVFESIAFFQQRYSGNEIDLSELKVKYPELPETVTIIPPDLSSFDNVVILIGINKEAASSPIIWIAGNYYYPEVTFFVDIDQDRDFTNDREPITLNAKKDASRVVILRPKGQAEQVLVLEVPKVNFKTKQKYLFPIMNDFAFGANLAFGSGKLQYSYQDVTIGYPTWYDVKYTEKSFGISSSYNTQHFIVGLNGSFQNLFYYTSHLNVQKGDPYYEQTIEGLTVLNDNVDIETNRDEHSTNRFQWSLFALARIKVGNSVQLQPGGRIGKVHYLDPYYNRAIFQEDQIYPIRPSVFYELNIRSEFVLNAFRSIYIDIARNTQNWEPVGFLEDTPHTSFESSAITWKLSVGYRFGLRSFE